MHSLWCTYWYIPQPSRIERDTTRTVDSNYKACHYLSYNIENKPSDSFTYSYLPYRPSVEINECILPNPSPEMNIRKDFLKKRGSVLYRSFYMYESRYSMVFFAKHEIDLHADHIFKLIYSKQYQYFDWNIIIVLIDWSSCYTVIQLYHRHSGYNWFSYTPWIPAGGKSISTVVIH